MSNLYEESEELIFGWLDSGGSGDEFLHHQWKEKLGSRAFGLNLN